jgi:hypothetical protein
VTVIIFAGLAFILHLVIAVVLVRKYMHTRDAGFIWLGVAVVIWPLVSKLLDSGERVLFDRLVRHQPIGFYPFSLVEHGDITIGGLVAAMATGQQLVGVILLFVAVLYLYRANDRRHAFSN